MKRLLAILFVVSIFFISGSMFTQHVKVQPEKKSIIETSDLGYNDIPADNGL